MVKLSDSDAVDLLRSLVDPTGVNPERLRLEEHWVDTIAYYMGVQRFVRGIRHGLGLPRDNRRGRIHYTVNLIKPNVLRNVARVGASDVTFDVRPRNRDIDNVMAAEAARKYFQFRRQQRDHERARASVDLWSANTGLAFTKLTWDFHAAPSTRIFTEPRGLRLIGGQRTGGETPSVNLSEAERQRKSRDGEFVDIPSGRARLEALSPFSCVWDWRARDNGLEDAGWVVHRTLMHRKAAAGRYPGNDDRIRRANSWQLSAGSMYFLELIASMVGGQEGLMHTIQPEYERGDLVLVDEYWQAPDYDPGSPEGRRIVRIGDTQVVHNGPNDYQPAGLRHPFIAWRWMPNPGALAGAGVTGEMMQAQNAYNEDRSRMREQIARAGNPRVFAPRNSGVREEHLTSEPNNLVHYLHSAGMPTQVPASDMPVWQREEVARSAQEADMVAAETPLDKGQVPGQLRGSLGVRMLLDRNDEVRNPILLERAINVADLGRMELQLADQFLTDQLLLQITGEGSITEAVSFTGADVRGNFDVYVTRSQGPGDRSIVKVADLDFLLERGVLDPANRPEDRALVLRVMRFEQRDDIWSSEVEEELDERVVLSRMIKSPTTVVAPNPWDIPEARLRAINSTRRKRDLWEGLPEAVRSNINARAAVYEERIAQAQMQALQLQMQMGGAPKPLGQPSQPKPKAEVA